MSDLRKAAQQALEAMDYMLRSGEWYCAQERADALRAALAVPESLESAGEEDMKVYAAIAKNYTKRVPLTEEVLKKEFAKMYKSDAAILHLAENNKNYALESIGARHHWAAFESGARAIEAAHGIS